MDFDNLSLRDIEKKWQSGLSSPLRSSSPNGEHRYILEMWPYPSGKIHMGHVRNYSIGDVMTRYLSLCGKNVFHPMGWDGFGLPAENAAIERGVAPREWTETNINQMRTQIQSFGFCYDWEKTEIKTYDPKYYRWNQWLFSEFFKRGLAYKKEAHVNYCSHCQTVLANEQVVDGKCWRCGTTIIRKKLSQWYLKITQYAQTLLEQHKLLEGQWPERVLNMQKRWIGKSEGVEVDFSLRGYDKIIRVFTTQIATLPAVTFLVLSPEHPWIQEILETSFSPSLQEFLEELTQDALKNVQTFSQEKKGFFTGYFSLHPLTQEPLPIYIANYVSSEYGQGAVMGVPAHDSRDFDFAKKYELPITPIFSDASEALPYVNLQDSDIVLSDGEFSGLTRKELSLLLVQKLSEQNKGRLSTQYRLRDWLISRQRYWGTPIPIIDCPQCGSVLVPQKELPVLLPEDVQFTVGKNPILSSPTFADAPCPKCGGMGKRETDTMDTFFDSSWYFARYLDIFNDKEIFSKKLAWDFLPVNTYIGGIEHAVLHLLYARFFYIVLAEMDLVPGKEPFAKLITQGMVLAPSHYCSECRAYYNTSEMQGNACPQGHEKDFITTKMEKMSKSKNNGVDPEQMVQTYGCDASRLFVLFAAPIDKDLEWNEQGVIGCYRFLKRILQLTQRCAPHWASLEPLAYSPPTTQSPEEKTLLRTLNKTIQDVRMQMENLSYNTAIAKLMEFLRTLENFQPHTQENFVLMRYILGNFSLLLYPLSPHIAQECYALVYPHGQGSLPIAFPQPNLALQQEEEIPYVVQWNGKVKGMLKVDPQMLSQEIEKRAHALLESKKLFGGQTIVQCIFVKDKVVNFVTKPS